MQVSNIQIFAAAILLGASADVWALSYECVLNGETVLQAQPCPGVVYPENLTAPSKYAGTKMTLPELLAGGAAAKENISNRNKADAAANYQRSGSGARSGRWR